MQQRKQVHQLVKKHRHQIFVGIVGANFNKLNNSIQSFKNLVPRRMPSEMIYLTGCYLNFLLQNSYAPFLLKLGVYPKQLMACLYLGCFHSFVGLHVILLHLLICFKEINLFLGLRCLEVYLLIH